MRVCFFILTLFLACFAHAEPANIALARAMHLTRVDKFEEARALLSSIKPPAAVRPWVKLFQARIAARQGNPVEALSLLQQIPQRGASGRFAALLKRELLDEGAASSELVGPALEFYRRQVSAVATPTPTPKPIGPRELAIQAWGKNDYKTAQAQLKNFSRFHPVRLYVEGRMAEEQGDYETAKRRYAQLLSERDAEFGFWAGMRMGWLAALKSRWGEALNSFEKVARAEFSQAADEQNTIAYWIAYSSARKAGREMPPQQEFPFINSYYFWLTRGSDPAEPTKAVSFEPAPAASCSKSTPKPSRVSSVVKVLSAGGYGYLAAQELLADQSQDSDPTTDISAIFSRATAQLSFGQPILAFRTVLGEPALFNSLKQNCPSDLAALLYPKLFQIDSQLDPALVRAVIRAESRFDPFAISPVGAQGLMQLMPTTATLEGLPESESWQVFEPNKNIELGTKHLARQLSRFGGRHYLAIAAYNAGAEAVERWLKRYPDAPAAIWIELIPYKETRKYVKEVLGGWWVEQHN